VLIGISQGRALANGFCEYILDILINEFIMSSRTTRTTRGRLCSSIQEGGISTGCSLFLNFRLAAIGFKGSSFHVGRFDNMLKEFLDIGKGINDCNIEKE